MAKVKSLVGNPADFHLPITMQELDGTDAEFVFTCKGRTLRDWHPLSVKRMTADANAMLDAVEAREAAEAKNDEPAVDDVPKPKSKAKAKTKRIEVTDAQLQESVDKGLARTTEIIREVASGWDLDDEFNDENIGLMCSRYPGVHQRLWEQYDARVRGNRLGN